jgi:polyisoprenoid-binding protein YceI
MRLSRPPRRHRLTRLAVGAVVVLAILLVGGPFVYIHFIEGPAPKPLTLPTTTPTSSSSANTSVADLPSGPWHATSASQVGYRVHEVLFGQNNEAVGRTHSITGGITLSTGSVQTATFTVQMATVHSDQSQRDTQFDGRIMDVTQYPTSTFRLTQPIALNAKAKPGAVTTTTATGDLTLHGQTHLVTFPVKASYTSSAILINGSIPITFSDYGIGAPGYPGITVDSNGLLEFLLTLHPGAS